MKQLIMQKMLRMQNAEYALRHVYAEEEGELNHDSHVLY